MFRRSNSSHSPDQPIQPFPKSGFQTGFELLLWKQTFCLENLPLEREKSFLVLLFPSHTSSPQADHPASRTELPPGTLEAHLNLWQAPLRATGHTEGPRAQTSISEVWLAQGAKLNPVPRTTSTVLVADEPGVSNTMFSPSVNIKKKYLKASEILYTMCGGSTTHGKSSLFCVVFRHSHLSSAPHSHQSPPGSQAQHLSGLGMICLDTKQHQPSLTSWSQHSSFQTQIYHQLLSRLEEMPACLP